MLLLKLKDTRGHWDVAKQDVVFMEPVTLRLEHSLLSLSKWEEKWKKPFLDPTDTNRPLEQSLDYIRCMMLDDVDLSCLRMVGKKEYNIVAEYISTYQGATRIKQDPNFHGKRGNTSGKILTSESIYCMMVECGIEKAYETWNLTRLMKLIELYGEHQKPKKKQSKAETLGQYASLNAKRRRQLGM